LGSSGSEWSCQRSFLSKVAEALVVVERERRWLARAASVGVVLRTARRRWSGSAHRKEALLARRGSLLLGACGMRQLLAGDVQRGIETEARASVIRAATRLRMVVAGGARGLAVCEH
jgi:hypothetical protein